MKYPENIKTKKQRAVYWFFKQYYIINMGKGQVLGRIKEPVTDMILLVTFFELYLRIHLNKFALVAIFLTWLTASYLIGLIYMYYSCDKIDAQVSTERNPIMKDIHKSTVKKRGKL